MRHISLILIVCFLFVPTAWAGRAKLSAIAKDPYVSALVVDADSGKILFEDHADTKAYPASVLKLMVLLVILDRIELGALRLDEMVQVTKEAAQMGGSQVYLDPKEQFSIEDLLYAVMIQSANDAAVALAAHVAGSKDGFVALMNQKAKELGMKNTSFQSVHGLPPSTGQKVDTTTARDLSKLAIELAKRPQTFKYTGIRERDFRGGEFIMRTHNHLLSSVGGCDGFKTGYFTAAGFSIVATAKRSGVRIIAIVMGSKDRKVRDAKAKELLAKGFREVPPKLDAGAPEKIVEAVPQKMETDVTPLPQPAQMPVVKEVAVPVSGSDWTSFFWGVVVGIMLSALVAFLLLRKRSRKRSGYYRNV